MKAIVFREYGSPDVLHIEEIEKPVPRENEILVRVHAASVNFGDTLARNFRNVGPGRNFSMPSALWLFARLYFGFSKPRITILGNEFSGTVESTGKKVRSFKPGDCVFGYLGQAMGTYAEYIRMPETGCVAIKPDSLSFEEAAAIPYGAVMAISLLRRAHIQPGQRVLINGASGGIGSAAVQIAKCQGAHVTGVCGTPRLGYVGALGADKVIDYSKEDFTRNGETYDLIFDIRGKLSFSQCRNSLTPNGRLQFVSFKSEKLLQMIWTSLFGTKKVVCAMAPGSAADLRSALELIEPGKLKTIVDRCFPMEQTAEAHRYAESGGKKGAIVIRIAQ